MRALWFFLAGALTIPALAYRLSGLHLDPEVSAVVFGVAILGAAALLSWAAEVAEMDISQGLAVALLAIIAVLPEYAVDMYFSWQAGANPDSPYGSYATANMMGANRLLIGLALPIVFLLFWLGSRRRTLVMDKGLSVEQLFLAVATLYSFIFFLKGTLAIWDTLVYLTIYGVYVWAIARAEVKVPELMGPAAALGRLRPPLRRSLVAFLFLFSAGVIFSGAEPFAESLLSVSHRFNIEEFILVQWIAPLASEAPEVILAALFALRSKTREAMGILMSARLNQWTLLVGTIPLVYSIALGKPGSLMLDSRQVEEFLLTSAQSLYAVVLLASLRFSWKGALILLLLFSTQLLFTQPQVRYYYSYAYLALSAFLCLTLHREHIMTMIPAALNVIRGKSPG